MTVQNLYTQYLDGKITKQKFLYEVRRDQHLDMISSSNSFEDVVKILKNKSIISEKAHKEAKLATGKQEVDIIAKTIDMVNPYEYSRGMNYELDIMDVPATSGDLSEDNILKAQKKVLANLTKNPTFYFDKINGKGEVSEEWVEATKKEIEKIGKAGKGKSKVIREGLEVGDVKTFNGEKVKVTRISDDGRVYVKSVKFSKRPVTWVKPEDLKEKYEPNQKVTFTNKNDGNKYEGTVVQDLGNGRFTFRAKDGKVYGSEGLGSNWKIEISKRGMDEIFEQDFISRGAILKALKDVGSEFEIRQYLTSLEKSGDEFETIDDYIEDFRNYVADRSLEEHGQYADRVADVNADSTPLKEREEAIYEKYAKKMGKSIDEVKSMVQEAKAKNLQEADDTPEEKKAKDLGIAAEKAKIAAANKKIQDLNQGK
jgi:hypothetical protein